MATGTMATGKGDFMSNLGRIYGIYTGGFIAFIILMATDGNPGENHYGPNPYGRAYGC